MRMPPRWLVASLLVLAAVPAQAGDLTGIWKGKFKCKLDDGDSRQKLSSREVTSPEAGMSTLEVSHPDGPDTQALQLRIDDVLFAGFVLPEGATTSGIGAIVDCNPNDDPGIGFGEIRSFRWKATPDDVKGSIAWRGMLVSDDAVIGSCRGKWRRVSRMDPGIAPCR
jgi:hypothetical protein